jgi:hypothetical protein
MSLFVVAGQVPANAENGTFFTFFTISTLETESGEKYDSQMSCGKKGKKVLYY